MRIFVVVGTQEVPFQRLINYAEQLSTTHDIVIQYGYTPIIAQPNVVYRQFYDKQQYQALVKGADIILCHGGAGTIFEMLKLHKNIIVVPREAQYQEHVDNHQLELAKKLSQEGYLFVARQYEEILTILDNIKQQTLTIFEPYSEIESSILEQLNIWEHH